MKKKRIYGAVDVEKFDVGSVLSLLTVGCIVAVDVAKTKFVAALATAAGEVVRLLRFEHPRQTGAFLRLLVALREAKLEPHVVMEPTGTYGDALRYQCHRLELPVHMMSPKHTHDFAEVLDGVPSMHDPKAAVALARLQAVKPAKRWEPEAGSIRDLRAVLDLRGPAARTQALYYGLLEGMSARHWPELGTLIDVRTQHSWKALLKQLPGPRLVAMSREEASKTLRQASRGRLGHELIAAVVESASKTLGVPMTQGEEAKLRTVVEQIDHQTQRLDALDSELSELVHADPVMTRLANVVGPACAAALFGYIGSPLEFSRAAALEKAMGLNLKERSSGEKKGRLSITKRGPGEVRQLLYLAALRLIQSDPIVAAWYRGRRAFQRENKVAAVVAVMRKLSRALWYVARGDAFDATKLFDTRRLDLTKAPAVKDVSMGPSSPIERRNEGGVPQSMQ